MRSLVYEKLGMTSKLSCTVRIYFKAVADQIWFVLKLEIKTLPNPSSLCQDRFTFQLRGDKVIANRCYCLEFVKSLHPNWFTVCEPSALGPAFMCQLITSKLIRIVRADCIWPCIQVWPGKNPKQNAWIGHQRRQRQGQGFWLVYGAVSCAGPSQRRETGCGRPAEQVIGPPQ